MKKTENTNVCPKCNGDGKIQDPVKRGASKVQCPLCKGLGKFVSFEEDNIKYVSLIESKKSLYNSIKELYGLIYSKKDENGVTITFEDSKSFIWHGIKIGVNSKGVVEQYTVMDASKEKYSEINNKLIIQLILREVNKQISEINNCNQLNVLTC